MRTDNSYSPYEDAGTNQEIDDLAPELTMKEATELTKKFQNELPDDIIDIDLGNGL